MIEEPTLRQRFLREAARFVRSASAIPGVRRISLVGSIVTTKSDPKDIDLLLVITDDADLAALARCARRLQGTLQGLNRTADVFLANERGCYLGRTCYWRDCRPGLRQACDALHCGRRPHLHDDVQTLTLDQAIIARPPVTVWPLVECVGAVPPDVEQFLHALGRGI